jgi:hypothetical protein
MNNIIDINSYNQILNYIKKDRSIKEYDFIKEFLLLDDKKLLDNHKQIDNIKYHDIYNKSYKYFLHNFDDENNEDYYDNDIDFIEVYAN